MQLPTVSSEVRIKKSKQSLPRLGRVISLRPGKMWFKSKCNMQTFDYYPHHAMDNVWVMTATNPFYFTDLLLNRGHSPIAIAQILDNLKMVPGIITDAVGDKYNTRICSLYVTVDECNKFMEYR